MKGRLLPIIVMVSLCAWAAVSSASTIDPNEFELLIDAVAQAESNNNPRAVGDNGRALGAYQIHRAYWRDGTRLLGVYWSYKEAFDPKKARSIVKAYLLHYGRGKSLIEMARIHNGGPNGYRKKSTLGYARKITTLLRSVG
jgi:soluble lytic murein transglycosylase-like protein